jgi:hypothetical protein
MYGSGHKDAPSRVELGEALRLLDRALLDQRAHVQAAAEEAGGDEMLGALRRNVHLMEQEAQRLREMLASE